MKTQQNTWAHFYAELHNSAQRLRRMMESKTATPDQTLASTAGETVKETSPIQGPTQK